MFRVLQGRTLALFVIRRWSVSDRASLLLLNRPCTQMSQRNCYRALGALDIVILLLEETESTTIPWLVALAMKQTPPSHLTRGRSCDV